MWKIASPVKSMNPPVNIIMKATESDSSNMF